MRKIKSIGFYVEIPVKIKAVASQMYINKNYIYAIKTG